MKLNLLPTYVSKEKQTKVAIVLSVLVALAGIGAAVYMIIMPGGKINDLRTAIDGEKQVYGVLVNQANQADQIIQQSQMVIRNINLANAMQAHNGDYPALYDEVTRYVPSFFRVISVSAQPSGDQNSVVTVTGVLKTYQQYADLMLAMLKDP